MLLFQNGTMEAVAKPIPGREIEFIPEGVAPIQPQGSEASHYSSFLRAFICASWRLLSVTSRPVFGVELR